MSVDPNENDMDLICPFDSDDPEFVRGFEIGALWEKLKAGTPCEATVHATNAEMVIRLAESVSVGFSAEDLGEDWVLVRFH